jgi:broad specificity phosphatase PhoE
LVFGIWYFREPASGWCRPFPFLSFLFLFFLSFVLISVHQRKSAAKCLCRSCDCSLRDILWRFLFFASIGVLIIQMSRLLLVRHGQASFLEQDYDKLSKTGELQARLLGEYWAQRRVSFDHVYSGPRKRQLDTARIVGEAFRKAGLAWPEPEVMKEFDEYSGETVMELSLPGLVQSSPQVRELHEAFAGAQDLREKHRTFQQLFEVVIGKWASGEVQVENVEPWAEFSARVHRGLARLADLGGSRQIAVFSSGGPVGVTVQRALNLSTESTLQAAWMARNASISEFLFSGERFTLSSFNASPHLDDPALVTYR